MESVMPWQRSKPNNTAAATPWEWDTKHIASTLTQWENAGDIPCVEKWLVISKRMTVFEEPETYSRTFSQGGDVYLTEASEAPLAGMPRRAMHFLFTKDVCEHRLIAHAIDCALDRSQLRQLKPPTT